MRSARWSARLAVAAALAVFAFTTLGLLCSRIDDYDDAALLMGARLVRAGRLPFLDFYTHYGPFGYSVQAFFSARAGHPALGLRIGEAAAFGALAFLALRLARRAGTGPAAYWGATAFLLALSPAALLASFYGFAFAGGALGVFLVARSTPSVLASRLADAGSGVLLAAAALTRPAFALYAGFAILLLGLAAGSSKDRSAWPALGAAAIGFLGGMAVLWIALYARIPVGMAASSMLVAPARLMGGGARYRPPPFLDAPLPLAMAIGGLLAAVPLLWSLAVPGRRARILGLAGVLVGGALAPALRASETPARYAALASAAVLGIVALLAIRERDSLRSSPALFGAALCGIGAAGFGHYFWTRPDRPHLIPYLVLGAAAVALASERMRPAARGAAVALLLLASPVFFRAPGDTLAPVEALWNGGLRAAARNLREGAPGRSPWPATEVPLEAAAAAADADRRADPDSRFVAYASSHASTDRNPVLLFLLSRRLPYTRWYAYDPGVQSSAPVQAEMEQELARSGSASAVVWRAEAWGAPGEPVERPATAFDLAAARRYPDTAALYGPYAVREESPEGEGDAASRSTGSLP